MKRFIKLFLAAIVVVTCHTACDKSEDSVDRSGTVEHRDKAGERFTRQLTSNPELLLEGLPALATLEILINDAIRDLKSPDSLKRRRAATFLAKNTDTPGIQRVIKPCEEVFLNTSDSMTTRALCGAALGRISAQIGSPIGDKIIPTLSQVLADDSLDLVRAWAAQALGLTNSQLAVDPLLAACDDESPVVEAQVELSLRKLANATCAPDQTLAVTVKTIQPLSLQSETTSKDGKADWESYLKSHVIFMPPIDIDDLKSKGVQQ